MYIWDFPKVQESDGLFGYVLLSFAWWARKDVKLIIEPIFSVLKLNRDTLHPIQFLPGPEGKHGKHINPIHLLTLAMASQNKILNR